MPATMLYEKENMAMNRMPFLTLLFVFFAVDSGCLISVTAVNFSSQSTLPAVEGGTLILDCRVNATSFPSSYYLSFWKLNSYGGDCIIPLAETCSSSFPSYGRRCYCMTKSSSGLQRFQLKIHTVQLSDAQNWICGVSYYSSSLPSQSASSSSLAVTIYGRPTRPTLSALSTAVPVGGDVTLTCSSQPTSMPASIRTPLEYTWRKGGTTLTARNSSTLVLENVQRNDEGRYSCNSKESGNSLSSDWSNEIYVDIQYAPGTVNLVPSTPSYEVRETNGSVPNIRCQADCDPACLFRWTDKGGNPVGGTGNDLQLTSLRREQSGIFTCSASNHLGVSTAEVNITAVYPPEVTLTQTEVRLEEGDNVTVLCHVDASPPAVVSWSKDSATGEVTLQSSPLLELRGVGEGDAGLYTCTATNRLSSQESPSQASLRVHVTSQQLGGQAGGQAGAALTWQASMGIGLVTGCVISGVVAALVYFLWVRRRKEPKGLSGTNIDTFTYEDLDLTTRQEMRDNNTYESIQQHENQGFAKNEETNSGSQTSAKPDLRSQAAGEARTSRQAREEVKKQSKAAEKQKGIGKADEKGSRQSEVEEGEIGSSKEEGDEKKRNGEKNREIKEEQGRAAGMEGKKSTEVKEEEKKEGGKSRGKEKEVKESDVKQSPMTEEPLYINY